MTMTRIVGLSGSLRRASFNAGLLRAAVAVAPPGCVLEAAGIRDIPLYDADLEAASPPPAVTALQRAIDAADGLLIVTPEYNQSIPGVLKNAIDWVSSFPTGGDRIFRGLPVGTIGASAMWSGTINAQTAWLPVWRGLAAMPYQGDTLYVGGARDKFDAGGNLTDARTRDRLAAWLAGFAEFVAAHARRR